MARLASIIIFALLFMSTFCDSAMACPTCKSALHSGLALGYAISILFMMSMPFVIFTFWVVTILKLRSKATPCPYAEFTSPVNPSHREA